MTLDSISAHIGRDITGGVGRIAREALQAGGAVAGIVR
jgi:hypothetical protein